MQLKTYQINALAAFEKWREALAEAKIKSETAVAALESVGADIPAEIRNHPKTVWEGLRQAGQVAGDYVARTDDAGRPIPHVCLKVPTGGGKTLLAAAALERLNRPRGLVLWVVPTSAIYDQTKAALWEKTHPYRQMLERASCGQLKLLEKEGRFSPNDLANSLCVMLLMLQSANISDQLKKRLRMYRDSGLYRDFFPDLDDQPSLDRLLEQHQDLVADEEAADPGAMTRSLFNVLKLHRPVVVLDEVHKAYGRKNAGEYAGAISRFNPELVLELSATPKGGLSNLLVDISANDLKKEEMIKSPIQFTPVPDDNDWQDTLREAHHELERLTDEAEALEAEEGRYIRPIAVVRAQQTGKNERDGIRVHAEDVRDYLINELAVPKYAVRVKSSELDELGREDLKSRHSQVRWIITKDALKEGWDCSFAYVLALLDKTRAKTAVTQLVGRVMRQPDAAFTGRELLDQCYVYCWTDKVQNAVQQVKNGLEEDGMGDLADAIVPRQHPGDLITMEPKLRDDFAKCQILLPKVLHRSGGGWSELDYAEHILPNIDWGSIKLPWGLQPESSSAELKTIALDVDGAAIAAAGTENRPKLSVDKTLALSYFVQQLADDLPNSWLAADLAKALMDRLQQDGNSEEAIYDGRAGLSRDLRNSVTEQVEKLAEQVFVQKREVGVIRFDLASFESNYPMPTGYKISVPRPPRPLTNEHGRPMVSNLFDWVPEAGFNDLEREAAYCLDDHAAVRWWHRITARQQNEYYLRGWRDQRIFPDFVAMAGEPGGKPQLLVFETKGRHQEGNDDTTYKERVLKILEDMFNAGQTSVKAGPTRGMFRLVFDKAEIVKALNSISAAQAGAAGQP